MAEQPSWLKWSPAHREPAETLDARAFQVVQNGDANLAVEDLERAFFRGKQIRQIEQRGLIRKAAEERIGRRAELERAHLKLLDHFAVAAELGVRENGNRDSSVGLLVDNLREVFRASAKRGRLNRNMAKVDAHLLVGSRCGGRERANQNGRQRRTHYFFKAHCRLSSCFQSMEYKKETENLRPQVLRALLLYRVVPSSGDQNAVLSCVDYILSQFYGFTYR